MYNFPKINQLNKIMAFEYKEYRHLYTVYLFKKICPDIKTDCTLAWGTAPNISTRSWRECFSLISSSRTLLGPSPPIMKRTLTILLNEMIEYFTKKHFQELILLNKLSVQTWTIYIIGWKHHQGIVVIKEDKDQMFGTSYMLKSNYLGPPCIKLSNIQLIKKKPL